MVSDVGIAPIGRSGRGRGLWTAALGSAAVLLLLLFPSRAPSAGLLVQAAGRSVHVLLWWGVAWLWGRNLPVRLRSGPLCAVLALGSAAVEWIQPVAGRSAEWMDWLYGAGGAACLCVPWRRGVRWMGVALLCSAPLAWELALQGIERSSFPVLAEPGAYWSRRGWTLNGVRLARSSPEAFRIEGQAMEGDREPVAYPGVFRSPAVADWRGMRSWRTAVYWPGPDSVLFAVRVDDLPGNPPFAERFQREFSATAGWNAVEISVEELGRASGGRPMELGGIRSWGVFLVSNVHFDYFLMGEVRVELKEDRP